MIVAPWHGLDISAPASTYVRGNYYVVELDLEMSDQQTSGRALARGRLDEQESGSSPGGHRCAQAVGVGAICHPLAGARRGCLERDVVWSSNVAPGAAHAKKSAQLTKRRQKTRRSVESSLVGLEIDLRQSL
jgi:hypothetical protein